MWNIIKIYYYVFGYVLLMLHTKHTILRASIFNMNIKSPLMAIIIFYSKHVLILLFTFHLFVSIIHSVFYKNKLFNKRVINIEHNSFQYIYEKKKLCDKYYTFP